MLTKSENISLSRAIASERSHLCLFCDVNIISSWIYSSPKTVGKVSNPIVMIQFQTKLIKLHRLALFGKFFIVNYCFD